MSWTEVLIGVNYKLVSSVEPKLARLPLAYFRLTNKGDEPGRFATLQESIVECPPINLALEFGQALGGIGFGSRRIS